MQYLKACNSTNNIYLKTVFHINKRLNFLIREAKFVIYVYALRLVIFLKALICKFKVIIKSSECKELIRNREIKAPLIVKKVPFTLWALILIKNNIRKDYIKIASCNTCVATVKFMITKYFFKFSSLHKRALTRYIHYFRNIFTNQFFNLFILSVLVQLKKIAFH